MTPLAEAKHFVRLHTRHMGFGKAYVDKVLERIDTLEGEGAGSWVYEWGSEAEVHASGNKHQRVSNLYNLARFPAADSPAKVLAAQRSATSMATWLANTGSGERRVAQVGDVAVPFLFRAGPRKDAPLVIFMGGIVSLKEQWVGFLKLGSRIGCALALADFPGVGENQMPYGREAAKVFGGIMDATADDCDADRTLVVAPSFGGYLAMGQALGDTRVKGVVTVDAPMARFFADPAAHAAMPAITRSTLCHTCGVAEAEIEQYLAQLALTQEELVALPVPVVYVASLRDEIVPDTEWRTAATLNNNFEIYIFDDIHGSPNHLKHTRLLVLRALCHHAGRKRLARWVDRIGRWVLRINRFQPQDISA